MPYTADPKLAEFVRQLPKTETHLHIEGACPYELLRKIDPVKHANPPPFWNDDYRYKNGLYSFMPLYIEYCEDFFTSAERYHQAAEIMLKNCAAQGCRYVETSFHLPTVLSMKEGGADVVRAIKAGAPRGLEVRVFAGMCHNDYTGPGRDLIEDSLRWPELDGLDLAWPRGHPAGALDRRHMGPRTEGGEVHQGPCRGIHGGGIRGAHPRRDQAPAHPARDTFCRKRSDDGASNQ